MAVLVPGGSSYIASAAATTTANILPTRPTVTGGLLYQNQVAVGGIFPSLLPNAVEQDQVVPDYPAGRLADPTMVFACGGECRTFRHWSTSNGAIAPTFQSTFARNGGFALRFTTTAQTGDVEFSPPTATAVMVMRVYIYFVSLPAADQDTLVGLFPNSGTQISIGWTQSTAKFNIGRQAGAKTASTVVASAGVWYRLDWRGNCSANPWVIDWSITPDGSPPVLQAQFTDAQSATTFLSGLVNDDIASTTRDVVYDDILISQSPSDFPLGDGYVVGFAPQTTSGTHNQTAGDLQTDSSVNLTNGDSSGNRLTEVGNPDLTTFVKQVVLRATSYAEFLYNIPAGVPNPRFVCQASGVSNVTGTAANTEKSQLFDGTTAADAYPLTNVGATTLVMRRTAWPFPPTGGSWQAAFLYLLRLRWGFCDTLTTSVPFLTWSRIEIEWAGPFPASGAPWYFDNDPADQTDGMWM